MRPSCLCVPARRQELESDTEPQSKTGIEFAFPEVFVFLGQVATKINLQIFVFINIFGNAKTTSGRSGNGIKTPATAKPALSFGLEEFP